MEKNIKSFNKRLEALRSERASFIPLYQELSDYHLAHRGRFLLSDRNKGHKRNTKQINNTSRMAGRTLASGMMAGITSPARPWHRLSSGDADLDDFTTVKHWLFRVQTIMYKVFSMSNFYNSLHTIYSELGVFGTGCIGVYHNFENVIWCRPYTVGSYMLANNDKNLIDTFYREYEITVAQCVKQFGIDNVSHSVKSQWERGNTEAWVSIVHAVEPNDDRDLISPLAKDKAYRSVYYEKDCGSRSTENKFLRESGFDTFPVMAPRWDVTAEDVYATDCPGITALGDTKALQLGEKKLYKAVDKIADPPLQGPSNLKTKFSSAVLRGDEVLWCDQNTAGLTSIYGNYRPDVNAILMVNDKAEQRIKRAFYEDLFLMLANSDRRQITAREVAEKHEEKLLMLGPVLERLHTELLDPIIDRTFDILQGAGVLPPPPQELQGKELKVEYISTLAQAQRLVNTGSIDRLVQFAGSIAPIWGGARYKINAEQAVDEYADALGVDPSIIHSDEEVADMKAAEAQQMQAQQAMEMMKQGADVAKTASDVKLDEQNAVGAMMNRAGLM